MEGLAEHWFRTFNCSSLKVGCFRTEERKQVNHGLANPSTLDVPLGKGPTQRTQAKKGT